ELGLRQFVQPIALRNRVTAVAAQAGRLARLAAFDTGQMEPVREARFGAFGTGAERCGDDDARQQDQRRPAQPRVAHRGLPVESRSKLARTSVCASKLAYGDCTSDTPHKRLSASAA